MLHLTTLYPIFLNGSRTIPHLLYQLHRTFTLCKSNIFLQLKVQDPFHHILFFLIYPLYRIDPIFYLCFLLLYVPLFSNPIYTSCCFSFTSITMVRFASVQRIALVNKFVMTCSNRCVLPLTQTLSIFNLMCSDFSLI